MRTLARASTPSPSPRSHVTSKVRSARTAMLAMYFLNGLVVASWLARYPAAREALSLTPGQLGSMLIFGAGATVIMVAVFGPRLPRLGTRAVLIVSTVSMVGALAAFAVAVGTAAPGWFVVAQLLVGASLGSSNVPLNVEAAAIERAVGRTIIPQFHAVYAIGAALGAAGGAGLAGWGISPVIQMPATAVVVVVVRAGCLRHSLPQLRRGWSPHLPTGEKPASARMRWGQFLLSFVDPRGLLAAAVFYSAACLEGAANDWLAVAVVDGFSTPQATGAAVFAVFLAATAAVRLIGSPLIDRFGRVVVLRVSLLSAICGVTAFALAPTFGLGLVGVTLWGMGAALPSAIGIQVASEVPELAARRCTMASMYSALVCLASPLMFGFLGNHVGTRSSLLLVCAMAAVSLVLSKRVLPTRGEHMPGEAALQASSDRLEAAWPGKTERFAPSVAKPAAAGLAPGCAQP